MSEYRRFQRHVRRQQRRAERWQLRERRRQYVRAWLNAHPFGWVAGSAALMVVEGAVFIWLLQHAHPLLAVVWIVGSCAVVVTVRRWLAKPPIRSFP